MDFPDACQEWYFCRVPITHRDLAIPSVRSQPFSTVGWIFELKYDGFRVLAERQGDAVRMRSRRGNDMISAFPEIAACLRELPDLVIDGELVVLDAEGRPQFERLRRRLALKRFSIDHAARTEPAAIFAFDLLALRGKDLRSLPLLKRKAQLEKLLRNSSRIQYLSHVGDDGQRRAVSGLAQNQDPRWPRDRRATREVGHKRDVARARSFTVAATGVPADFRETKDPRV